MSAHPRVWLGHVGIEVSDLSAARSYYDRFFSALGVRRIRATGPRWLAYRCAGSTLWLTESRPRRVRRRPPRVPRTDEDDPISDHLAFQVRTERAVDRVQAAMIRRGFRPIYPTERQATRGGLWYVSAAWTDPDGVVTEVYAVVRRPRRAGGLERHTGSARALSDPRDPGGASLPRTHP
ncbi:MAG: hypothetical protein L3K19_04170 [Thermoplasmata archaeon]|nr:hypothetical protein [Thermoplasmata archaeon]